MFRIYFITAFRSLLKNRSVSLINILGLTIGLTAFLFILHYLIYETSYDRFFDGSERVYRINMTMAKDGVSTYEGAQTPRQMYFALKQELPGVEANTLTYLERCLIRNGIVGYSDQNVLWVDAGFEKVFPLTMLQGKADFKKPLTGVLSASKAKALFGTESPVGKIMKVNEGMPVEVTGVFADLPSNTHLDAEYFISINTFVYYKWIGEQGDWNWPGWWNYIRLKPGVSAAQAEVGINGFVDRHMAFLKKEGKTAHFKLQPLPDLHFLRGLQSEFGAGTNPKSLVNLLIVGLLTLLIAWINFVNLSTAQSVKRTHEILIRKLIGASRLHIWLQSLSESLIINVMAVILAYGLYLVLMIPFAHFFSLPLGHAYIPGEKIAFFLALACLTGIVFSSIYTSVSIFRMGAFTGRKEVKGKSGFKKGLVIAQLVISIVFISGTIIVFKQIRFMQNYQLGMKIDRVLILSGPASTNILGEGRRAKYLAFRREVLSDPRFMAATATMNVPGQEPRWRSGEFVRLDAGVQPGAVFCTNNADDGFINTYSLKLLAGQNFSVTPANNANKILINESSARKLGFANAQDAIGKQIVPTGDNRKPVEIIGVVADFHNEGLHKPVYPMVWNNDHPYEFGFYSIRVNNPNMQEAVAQLQKIYKRHFPEDPFNYFFADELFNRQYFSEVRFGKFYILLTILSLSIACLGLYGLLLHYINQKKKEIGIRKVNGAQVSEVMLFINRNFFRWTVIAFVIACPLVYWMMNKWLQDFAYHTDISWWIFAIAGLVTLFITVLTVSWQSYKASVGNPADALKYE
ncbi:MAG: ABC transporter permease [Bacteroidota bacterium]|nr:ABC transporter permease [Bacteroidota bacterium]